MEMKPVNSSNLTAVGYDEAKKLLKVAFKDGSIYTYEEVPKALYDGLLAAESQGKFFNIQIRTKGFKYTSFRPS